MVFQNYALYPHMTVRHNLALRTQSPADAEEGDRAAASTRSQRCSGSTSCSIRRPAHLSGGQRQRVAMGRAIVREPQAFLMDEPLSNLDAKLRVGMRASLSQLHARLGVTTMYVTHDQVEAMTLGQRVAVMRHGRILQVDAPQTLYRQPRDLFVAAFIGSPAMNLVEARIDGDDVTFGQFRVVSRPVPPASRGRDRRRARHPPRGLRGGDVRAGCLRHDRSARRGARRGGLGGPRVLLRRRAAHQRREPRGRGRRDDPRRERVAVQRTCRSTRADPRRRHDPPGGRPIAVPLLRSRDRVEPHGSTIRSTPLPRESLR